MKGPALTVVVGSDEHRQSFVLPYLLLHYYSAVLSELVEIEDKTEALVLHLPLDRAPAFGLVADWIHTGQFKLPLSSFRNTSRRNRSDRCETLCQTWLVVDKPQISTLIIDTARIATNLTGHTKGRLHDTNHKGDDLSLSMAELGLMVACGSFWLRKCRRLSQRGQDRPLRAIKGALERSTSSTSLCQAPWRIKPATQYLIDKKRGPQAGANGLMIHWGRNL